jgi:hypothetical protein
MKSKKRVKKMKRDIKALHISKENHKKLFILKFEKGFINIDELIEDMIKNYTKLT